MICILLFFSFHIANKHKQQQEGFIQKEQFLLRENDAIYDDFYVNIYDNLRYEQAKNKFELGEIVILTQMQPKQSRVLDIGSNTGNYLRVLHHNKVDVIGLEKHKAFIEKSHEKYPDIPVKQGDATESMLFDANSFTHINCLSSSIYNIKNKRQFFENCYKWLVPGGYLSLHLVNRNKFNPILRNANPLLMISPQKYAKERITTSLIQFNDFHYKGNFKYNKGSDIAYFEETIKDNESNKVRKHNHTLYMESQKHILSLAKECGFILKESVDMVTCHHEYEYIYILYKPE